MEKQSKLRGRVRPASQAGQALVEFAMVLPMLLLLTIFAADISYLTYQKNVMQTAARDAARTLAVGAGAAAAQEQANTDLSMGKIDPAGVRWTVEEDGTYVTVHLVFDRPMWMPGLPALLGSSPFAKTVPLSAGATFRKRG